MSSSDEDFYARLSPISDFGQVPRPENYARAPSSWHLVITDVEGSTKAIEAGRYKDVNALGVASIVAVRNAIPEVEIPFVFGGDGATLLVPGSRLEQLAPALRGLQARARDAFDLGMRAGVVPLKELQHAGHDVLVARYAASANVNFAMFAGAGLSVGEAWVKDKSMGDRFELPPGPAKVDFEGFECRWQPLLSQRGQVVSLLVQANVEDRDEAAHTYQRVIEQIEAILQAPAGPANDLTLKLADTAAAFSAEAKLKSGKNSGLAFTLARTKTRIMAAIGRTLTATGRSVGGFNGATYRGEVAENTDYRKFDDTLRMVLDLSVDELGAIESALAQRHAQGEISYGIHSAPAALMTCVIGDYDGNHMHFVDGSDGGYAMAAKQLKQQIKLRGTAQG